MTLKRFREAAASAAFVGQFLTWVRRIVDPPAAHLSDSPKLRVWRHCAGIGGMQTFDVSLAAPGSPASVSSG